MREELAKIEGKRHRFQATFERFGTKAFKNHVSKTILFLRVIDLSEKREVTDHLWFSYGKTFEKLDLKQGDEVIFEARVSHYYKRVRDEDPFDRDFYLQKDFKLRNPTNCKKLGCHPPLAAQGTLDVFLS